MNADKNINSEGANPDSEGHFSHCVITPCTELNQVFSLNCRGLSALRVTMWLRAGRSTRGGRGA